MLGTKRVAGREGCPCQEPVPTASPGGTLLGLLPGGGEFQLPAASHAGAWLLLELGARGVGDLVSESSESWRLHLCSEGGGSDAQVGFSGRS